MLRTTIQQQNRRGVVLIIALGLLALFAAVGISFAIVTKYERTAARNFKFFFQDNAADGAVDLPVRQLAEFGISQLIYDTRQTNSALRGHSLLRDMYGSPIANDGTTPGADPEAKNQNANEYYLGAYNGNGIFAPLDTPNTMSLGDPIVVITRTAAEAKAGIIEPKEVTHFLSRQWPVIGFDTSGQPIFTVNAATFPTGLFPTFPHNFTTFDPIGGRPQTTDAREPERYSTSAGGAVWGYFGYDEDYDYPDYNNWFLGMERADGQIIIPSFHRPYLVKQVEQSLTITDAYPNAAGIGQYEATRRTPAYRDNTAHGPGRGMILRPRELDVNASVVYNDPTRGNRWRDLLDLDGSGAVGDSPEELDVDTDGDGKKDAIWIDLGYPVQTVGGKSFKPLFAFKVLSLDGKVNLNAHGNYIPVDMRPTGGPEFTGLGELHNSNLGATTYEVNPKHALLLGTNLNQARTTELPMPDWQKDASGGGNGPVEYQALLGVSNGAVLPQAESGRFNKKGQITLITDRPGVSVTDAGDIDAADDNKTIYPRSEYVDDGIIGFEGPRDLHGVGRYFEPFNLDWVDITKVGGGAGAILNYSRTTGYFLNYPSAADGYNRDTVTRDFQAAVANLGGDVFTPDDPIETNLYIENQTDALFTASDTERLYRSGDIDTSVLSPRMAQLVEQSFGDPIRPSGLGSTEWSHEEYARQRMRRLFTHASWDLNRFSLPPNFTSVSDTVLGGTITEDLGEAGNQHRGQFPATLANDVLKWINQPTQGLHQRLNLSGKATPGNPAEPDPLGIYTDATAAAVDAERTKLAAKIYTLLYLAVRPNPTNLGQVRTLAQLAVNIVDFMDADDVMTILRYNPDITAFDEAYATTAPGPTDKVVMGFELPRVVVNEAFVAQYEQNSSGMVLSPSIDSVWAFAELRNLTQENIDLLALNTVRTNHSAYQIRVAERPTAGGIIDRVHVTDFTYADTTGGATNTTTILPNTYFVVGPNSQALDPNPVLPAGTVIKVPPDASGILFSGHDTTWVNGFSSATLRYERTHSTGTKYEVGLYRLRNPFAAYDPTTNPYVQIDKVICDPSTATPTVATIDIPNTSPTMANRFSRQRVRGCTGEVEPWVAANFDPTSDDIAMAPYLGSPDITAAIPADLITFQNLAPSFGLVNPPPPGVTAVIEYSFPFLNRRLATPLELLSVRLYGVHRWTPITNTITVPSGYPFATPGGEDYRLRFTDDFAHIETGATARAHRDRPTPWLEDNRYTHPNPNANVPPGTAILPDLFRFFEFVECASRNYGAEVVLGPTGTPSYPRQVRVPGKICLNTITDEEVFRALFDDPWVMPSQDMQANGSPQTPFKLPPNYWDSNWSSSGGLPVGYNPVFPFNPRRNLLFARLFDSEYSDGSTRFKFGYNAVATGISGGQIFFADPVTSTTPPTTSDDPAHKAITEQWPGIDVDTSSVTVIPGRLPSDQVHSEMYRMFLLSRAGADGITGTGDDKPFRSFASSRLSDTLLRKRNHGYLDNVEGGLIETNGSGEYVMNQKQLIGGMTVSDTAPNWVPRLFDPVPLPFAYGNTVTQTLSDNQFGNSNPSDFNSTGPLNLSNVATELPLAAKDTWLLEHERNRLMGKIAGNVTTRSHVFGCWMTVGFFAVEPGTENASVPCLNEEIGIDDGTNVRHRMFFIVDRSKATKYEGPPAAPKSLDTMASEGLLSLPGQVSIIE